MSRAVGPNDRPEPRTSICVKFSLFFLNVLFWLVGTIVLAFGVFILVETKDLYQQLTDLAFQPSMIFFLVGVVIFVITFIGCIGALRENTCLLATYSLILTVILLMMLAVAVVGFLYKDKAETTVASSLKISIKYYRDPKRQDLQNLIDATQSEFKCCGIHSYNDWDDNDYFKCSAEKKTVESCGVPFSCCLTELQLNRQCGYGIRRPSVNLTLRRKSIYTAGCIEQGKLWFSDNLILIGSVSVAILLLQLISILFSNKLRGEVNRIKQMQKLTPELRI